MNLKLKDNPELKLNSITQLEYIESTGTQWIDTGIQQNNITAFDLTCVFKTITNENLILGGKTGSWNWNDSMLLFRHQDQLQVGSGNGSSKYFPGTSLNIKYTINFTNGNITINSSTQSIGNFTKSVLLSVFRGGGKYGQCQLFSLKLYNGSSVLRDFVPAKDSNDVVCLYDTVSKTFFYNQGTGNFVAGPEVPNKFMGLPANILLKTTTLYHKNTPNVNGLQLLNGILNYQKTHQDEIKEDYYPTTQLWQDIITEYPDIVQYYNMNHKLCVVICEADDPEQCAEDFLATVDDIQQELEDYPDLIPIIAENPSLVPIIDEWNPIVHSLVNTGYENALIGDGNSWIDTSDMINDNTNYEIKFNADNSNTGEIFGNGILNNMSSYVVIQLLNKNKYSIVFKYSGGYNNNNYIANNGNHIFEIRTSNSVGNIIFDNNILATNISIPQQSYNSYLFGIKQSASNPSIPFAGSIFYYKTTNNADNIIKYLTPFYRNGHYGMIDLITLTFYPNVGSGEFTYSLKPKNA